jgi:hypothetical protein
MILGYSGFAFASSFFIFIALACLSGCGGGGLLAAMAVRIAGMTDPDKTYGYVYSMASVVFAGLLFLLPQIKAGWGAAAMFIFIATVAAAMIFPLARLPQHVSTNSGEGTQASPTRWSFVIILILVMTISLPVYGGTYGFCERKALEVGLSPAGVGGALGGAMLMSIIGSLSVAIVGTRPGRTLPTMVVMAIAGISYLLVLGAHTPMVFIIGFMMFGFMQLALNSYLFGLASALDRSGHVAAALQGFSLVPYGLGAGLFGTLTHGHSLAQLAWPSLIVEVLAMAILLPVLVTLDRAKARRCPS